MPAEATKCEKCGTKLTFVGQLYANVDDLFEFHRLIYIFACVSQQCINSQCIRVFREIMHGKNKFLPLASEDEYNEICDKSDDDLLCTGKWQKAVEAVPRSQVTVTNDLCVLEEYEILTQVETKKFTDFYVKQSQRIFRQSQPNYKPTDADEELFEELEHLFTNLHFGNHNRDMENRAAQMLEQVEKEESDDDDQEAGQEDVSDKV